MIKIKVRFEDCLEPISSASTAKEISILAVFQTHPALRAPAVHGVSSIKKVCHKIPSEHKVMALQSQEIGAELALRLDLLRVFLIML